MRLVSVNTASGRDRRGRPAHAAWTLAAAAAQEDVDADVWALQEVDHRLARSGSADQVAQLSGALPGTWTSRFAPALHGTPGSSDTFCEVPADHDTLAAPDEPAYGIALLSRLPVLAWHEHRMTPSSVRLPVPLPPGADRRVLWVPDEPRVALAAVLDSPGGPVTVVTTHLSFAPLRAASQLREVARWAAALPRPLVLLGDLNLPGRVPALTTRLASPATGPTYPSHRPRVRLDHALLDAGTDHRTLGARTLPVGETDHLALVVDLG